MTSLQRFVAFHSSQLLLFLLMKRQTPSQPALFLSLSLSLSIYSFFPPSAQADWKRSSKLISQTCDFQFQTPDTNPTHTLNIHAEGPELRHRRCPDLRSPNHTHLISLFKETRERESERGRGGGRVKNQHCLQRHERASAAFGINAVKRVFGEIFTPFLVLLIREIRSL